MRLIQCYMRQSTWYKGAGNGTPKGVLWHSTGADNPYISRYVQPDDDAADREEMIALLGKNKYNNDWNHITRNAGVNAFIGKLTDGSIATVEAGPHTMKAWGVGDDADKLKNGWSLNSTHLQFEICEDGLDDKAYFEKVYQEASEYTAMICEEFGLDPLGTFVYKGDTIPVITDHAGSHAIGHGGNHGDVGHWFRKYLGSDYMDDIRKNVKRIIDEHKAAESPTEAPERPTQPEQSAGSVTYYRVQIGAYTVKENAAKQSDKAKAAGFSAYVVKDGKYYKVQVGAYTVKANAEKQLTKVKDAGFDAFITIYVKEPQTTPEASETPQKPAETPKPTITGTASTGSRDDEKALWDYLMKHVGNEHGVAGLMGNLYAESALRSNNLQQTYEKKLGYTDDTYTAAVDNGTYTNFVKDSAGYGLAQWTYWSRKEAMLKYHQERNKSIADFETQIAFLMAELSGDYKNTLAALKGATSVLEASNAVLMQFERPADQGDSVQKKRAAYGQTYYDRYATNPAPVEPEPAPQHAKKTNEELAQEVIDGKWGNGADRKNRLTAAGYDYAAVQAIVNAMLAPKPVELKVGDKVKMQAGATLYGDKAQYQAWVYKSTLYVRSISGDRVVVSTYKDAGQPVTGPVDKKYLTKV